MDHKEQRPLSCNLRI